MQRSSNKIGTLAAALAKAQAEIINPEKSLTARKCESAEELGKRLKRRYDRQKQRQGSGPAVTAPPRPSSTGCSRWTDRGPYYRGRRPAKQEKSHCSITHDSREGQLPHGGNNKCLAQNRKTRTAGKAKPSHSANKQVVE